MKKRLSSTLSLVVWSLSSFTRRKTWLISSGKRNLLNPMRRSISKVLTLQVCSILWCFFLVLHYLNSYLGRPADLKLSKLREWIQQQPSSAPSYIKETTPSRQYAQMGTLVTSLTCIGTILLQHYCSLNLNTWTAYILNLRGSDIPYNPLFHAYLFVGLESAVLFVETSKVQDDVASYLKDINVQVRPYLDLWPFLRRREWGEGKVSFQYFQRNLFGLA